MSNESATVTQAEVSDHDRKQLEEIIEKEENVNARIADIEMLINQLRAEKQQLLEEKDDLNQRKERTFEDIIERYSLNPELPYEFEDGVLKAVEQDGQLVREQDAKTPIDLEDIDIE